MITIDLLNNHSQAIPALGAIWHEVLGKIWVPDVSVEKVIERFKAQLNETGLPMTFVAFDGTKPVGMCSLRENDGIRPDLTPWLGSLVIDPQYQNQAIGKRLIDVTKKNAKELGFEKLYLFAFDETLPDYYADLGWHKMGMDVFNNHPVTVMEYALFDKDSKECIHIPNTHYQIHAESKVGFDLVGEQLFEFNKRAIAPTQTPDTIFKYYVIKENGFSIAGIHAIIYLWKILFVDILFVSEAHRGKDLGSILLRKVEDEAKAMGAKLAHLDTLDFQAKGFYEKHGYEVFGVLDDCPEGHQRYYMKKKL
jgi:N-acetylglutamate synthase-like GNAT family acetyltransferase